MSACTQINIKEGMPPADEALRLLENGLKQLRSNGFECVVIIHGYGSSGKGGTICSRSRHWLKEQEQKHRIRSVIYGEEFTLFNKHKLINGEIEYEGILGGKTGFVNESGYCIASFGESDGGTNYVCVTYRGAGLWPSVYDQINLYTIYAK